MTVVSGEDLVFQPLGILDFETLAVWDQGTRGGGMVGNGGGG